MILVKILLNSYGRSPLKSETGKMSAMRGREAERQGERREMEMGEEGREEKQEVVRKEIVER